MKKSFLWILIVLLGVTLLHPVVSFISMKISGYQNMTCKSRLTVDKKFQWGQFLSGRWYQIEGQKKRKLKSDTIKATQHYEWGEKFTRIEMQPGQDKKAQEWTDSLQKGFGGSVTTTEYFYGRNIVGQKVHGLSQLLMGKEILSMKVTGYASPEGATPESLLVGHVDSGNITLAYGRAENTTALIKSIFKQNGKNIDTIKTDLYAEELQLSDSNAVLFSTLEGFAAIKASNRSRKDTMGFNAYSALSPFRYTQVIMTYVEQKGKDIIVTQPVWILFFLPLLLSLLFSRKQKNKVNIEDDGSEVIPFEEIKDHDDYDEESQAWPSAFFVLIGVFSMFWLWVKSRRCCFWLVFALLVTNIIWAYFYFYK